MQHIIESGSIYLALFLLFAGLNMQLWLILHGENPQGRISSVLRIGVVLLILLHLVLLSVRKGFPAITAQYEALVLFSGLILVVTQTIQRVRSATGLATLVDVFAILLLVLSSSPLVPYTMAPPMPALRSGWMFVHIVLAFFGEAFFTVAFGASIMFLATTSEEKRARLDRITYISIAYGYVLFTLGALVFGAIWAYQTWGRYWGWDPKETWALITWLVYSVYLHIRFIGKRSPKAGAITSVAGYLVMLFTLFGVNWLYSSIHAY